MHAPNRLGRASPPNCASTTFPTPVVRRAEDLLVDWFGSALAGHGARPVRDHRQPSRARWGPPTGPSEVLIARARAAARTSRRMVNAAASHVAEQDDVHNGSVFHPATVVFPAALAMAQALGASGAAVAGGGGRRLRGRHPRRRVPRPLALQGLPHDRHRRHAGRGRGRRPSAGAATRHACSMPSARPARSRPGSGSSCAPRADSKQLHTAHAAAAGLMSAYLARDGFTGARAILEGAQGMAAGMSSDADPRGWSTAWARAGRWPRPRSSTTRRAATRIRRPMRCCRSCARTRCAPDDIARVVDACAPGRDRRAGPGGRSGDGAPVEVLDGHRARAGGALSATPGWPSSTRISATPTIVRAARPRADGARSPRSTPPTRSAGSARSRVHTPTAACCSGRVDEPKGDPGNTLSRDEIKAKALRLAAYSGGATEAEMHGALERLWHIARCALGRPAAGRRDR